MADDDEETAPAAPHESATAAATDRSDSTDDDRELPDDPEEAEPDRFDPYAWLRSTSPDESEFVDLWRRGRGNTLVRVLPDGVAPDPGAPVGICTLARYLNGLYLPQVSAALGDVRYPSLPGGATFYRVTKLPHVQDFLTLFAGPIPPDLRIHDEDGRVRAPAIPKLPRWNVTGLSQSFLKPIGAVLPAGQFQCDVSLFPAIR